MALQGMSMCSDPPFRPPEHTHPPQTPLWGILTCFTFYKTANGPTVAGEKTPSTPLKPASATIKTAQSCQEDLFAEKSSKILQNRVQKGFLQKNRLKFCKTVSREVILQKNQRKFRRTVICRGGSALERDCCRGGGRGCPGPPDRRKNPPCLKRTPRQSGPPVRQIKGLSCYSVFSINNSTLRSWTIFSTWR